MSAPASISHAAALDQLARALVRVLESAAERQAATTPDSAASSRPRAGGADPQQHEATPSPTKSRRRFEEDDRNGLATSTDN